MDLCYFKHLNKISDSVFLQQSFMKSNDAVFACICFEDPEILRFIEVEVKYVEKRMTNWTNEIHINTMSSIYIMIE